MAENKTKATKRSVAQFIKGLKDPLQGRDSRELVKLMQVVSGEKPKMWGPSIIGFGTRHYRYASGREGDICIIGFSPRASSLVLYGALGGKADPALMKKLGSYKTGKGCLYIKRLEDIHLPTLKKLVQASVKRTRAAAT